MLSWEIVTASDSLLVITYIYPLFLGGLAVSYAFAVASYLCLQE